MRFFKYLVFFVLSTISIQSFAANYIWGSVSGTELTICKNIASALGKDYRAYRQELNSEGIKCTLEVYRPFWEDWGSIKSYQSTLASCKAGETAFLDGYITSQTGVAPDSVCHSGCVYNSDGGGTAFDTPNGNLSWGINATKTGATCSTDTPKGEDKPNGDGTGGDGGDGGGGDTGGGGSDGGCTETGSTANCNGGSGGGGGAGAGGGAGGGGGGSGGKGGDGGAGGAGGQGGKGGDVTINMTPVVNAVNNMSSAIVNKLTSVASQITGSINDMKTSITDAIGITNSKVQAVKDEVAAQGQQTRSEIAKNTAAVNSVKQSVDANTQAVNDVKTAVKQQTQAINDVKASVDANTTALSAVKTAVDAVKESVNTVASKIDKAAADTVAAVNSSAQEITAAIRSDGQATREAINENGEKVTAAVKENTQETKKTNSLLQDLKDWLTGGELPQNPDDSVPTRELDSMSFSTELIKVNSAHCPAPHYINWTTPFGTINKEISFQDLCDQTAWFGYLVLAVAYFGAAQIVVRYS